MNYCLYCQKETKNAKYCNRSCAAKKNNLTPKRTAKAPSVCLSCGALTKNKKYCRQSCQHTQNQSELVSSWLRGESSGSTPTGHLSHWIRRWLLEKAGHKCSECGWSKVNPISNKIPLEIDHINGDHTDNRVENLRVLCPNCHSLTPTSKALNSNSSRKKYGFELLDRTHARPYRSIQ